ncbi:glycerophosphodiester phosphodiesterase family protein [Vibrio japonicus]|uniref:Glycerophosphoryl diester phosphodiesterase n=1 Tax=Vibrio japonicus TaxID=1824638 RepID=A0ABY5LKR8_9VIBR|nr:glycerophosphodiester phosphodiesterase family protein [Vibrio japonicus]UUM31692.1 glycerophosphoryl diester phosphodiesterase [Vibrio japonicus]
MIIVGHRGIAGQFPENTKASIMAAIELGLEWVEVDIQPTKDNHLVVCHDHTIDRCSNGVGRIDSFTLNELREFDFGGWFSAKFQGETIMTLEELLMLAQKHQLKLNLEIKLDKQNVHDVCETLKQNLSTLNIESESILLSSFSPDVIRELHRTLPEYRLGVLSERLTSQVKKLLHEVSAYSCNLNHVWTRKKHIESLHSEGFQVWCYTVNNPNRLKHLAALDAIFSDYPDRFL